MPYTNYHPSQGLIQDYDGKMETLQKLTDEYPESRYQVLSLLNFAQTYKDLERIQKL